MGNYYDGTKLLSMLDLNGKNQKSICVLQTALAVRQPILADFA